MKNIVFLTAFIILSAQSAYAQNKRVVNSVSQKNLPKNIILMIGDGMGLSQMYAAYTATQDKLVMTRCPNIALVKTFSDSDYITDSAAAGTAIATGHKTTNGMIGMLPDKTPVTSILKYAEDNNLATGLVATSALTHATPASFIASVESRKEVEKIALQFLYTDIDVFIGGGLDNFNNRTDSLNLIDSLLFRNYQVVKTIPEMMEITRGKLAALLYTNHAPKYSEGRGDMLSLSTSKAIDLLSSGQKGFFLMVEGSQIDWGGHDNDLDYVINETIDFDKACEVALDFAERNGETLVIITADHETGGLSIPAGDLTNGKPEGKFSTGDHSAIPVPLYAKGPGSEEFHGFIDNTDIFKTMFKLFGFEKHAGN
ncbi:MAG: alkaline phosphatase [Bacteroidales bacterium]|nr:alkaline phosphatase [Bacteroidales bacterium]